MLKGVDVSSYQSTINRFGNDVDFVICKATEGIGYVDPFCDALYQKAKRDGKLVGVYHFARPYLSGNTAEGEAEWFVQNIKGYLNEAILVLDWEAESKSDTAYAKRFLDKVYELTGVKPLVYASTSTINSYDWKAVVEGDYGLWVAQFGTDNGQPQQEPYVKDWGFYALWQYTSKGRIEGYDFDIDKDYFYGDRETWLKYANATGSENVETPVIKKTIEQVAQDVINGLYGNGDERVKKLTDEGYNYDEVQAKVNEILGADNKKSIDEIADEVIAGKWGNGQDRYNSLQKAGYNAAEVQNKVNEKLGVSVIKYTVQYGDTLGEIAQKYNTSINSIAYKNGIEDVNKIYVGQVLSI